MLPLFWFAGLVAGLVALYMLRQQFKQRSVSSARFFKTIPEQNPTLQFSLTRVLFTRSFWVQLTIFGLLVSALILSGITIEGPPDEALALLVAVDTSASMGTPSTEGTRMDAAIAEIGRLTDTLKAFQEQSPNWRLCASLLTFDSGGVRDVRVAVPPAALLAAARDELQHRALGSNIGVLQPLLDNMVVEPLPDCPATHLIVLSDLPAPDWVQTPPEPLTVLWRDVGEPQPNVGLTNVQPVGNARFGWNGRVEVSVAAYGSPPAETTLQVLREDDTLVEAVRLTWRGPATQTRILSLPEAGRYRLTVQPGGAYTYDDEVPINVQGLQQVRYAWQAPFEQPAALNALGWVEDDTEPSVRIIGVGGQVTPGIPTLIVGDFYERNHVPSRITYFEQASGILDDISLDVAETLRTQPISLQGIPHELILADRNDRADHVLVAANREAPFVYIPGLPTQSTNPDLDAWSSTLFFNALSWLLSRQSESIRLYDLTSAAQPEPDATKFVVALHENEGNTAQANSDYGDYDALSPTRTPASDDDLWPVMLLLAVMVLLLERYLSLFGGNRWA